MTSVAHRLAFAGWLLLHVAGSASGQDEALRAWIRSRFPEVRRATLAQCLGQAGREGILHGPASTASLKRAFRAEHRGALPARLPASGGVTASTGALDLETNDSPGWADDLGSGSGSASGEVSPVGDRDVFRFTLARDSTVLLTTQPAGPNPILDTVLTLQDQDGQRITFNDNSAAGLHAAIRTDLPAGVFFVQVEGYGSASGGYQLNITVTPTPLLQVQPGVPFHLAVAGPGHEPAARLVLAADAQVQVQCSGGSASFDPYLSLLRARGGSILGVDNAGTAGGFDPGLQTILPAGVYLLALGATRGSGIVQVRVQVTPAPVATLTCGATRSGGIQGEEWRDVYRLQGVAGSRLEVTTAPAGTTPVSDTVLEIFDRDFALVMRSDDDLSGMFGALDMLLPAGTYHAVVRAGFNGTGGYAVTARCLAAAQPTWLANGRNAAVVGVPGQTAAFVYRVATECPLQLLTDNTTGTIPFPILALLDASGRVLASDMWGQGPRGAAFGGALLAPGDYTVLVRDELGTPGVCDLLAAPMLYTEPRTPAATLNSMDKAGHLLILLCSPGIGPGIPLPAGAFSGVFLLQPAPLFVIATASVPASGFYPWPFVLPPSPPPLQALSIDLLTTTGRLTNLER